MLHVFPSARTIPITCAESVHSQEPYDGQVARHGVSTKTVRK